MTRFEGMSIRAVAGTLLQIVELTDKDQRDLLTLVLNHEVDEPGDDDVGGADVARLCAGD